MLWTDASTLRLQIMVSAAILECWTYDIMRFYGNLSYTSAFDPLLSNFEKKIRLRSCRFQVNAPDRHQTHPLPFPAIAGALVSGFFIRRRLFCCTCGACVTHQSSIITGHFRAGRCAAAASRQVACVAVRRRTYAQKFPVGFY